MGKGIRVSLEETMAEMRRRDQRDQSRELAPLRKAEDAMAIDSTNMTIDEVVDEMLKEARRRIAQGKDC